MESAVWVGIFVIIKGPSVLIQPHPETVSTQAEQKPRKKTQNQDEEINKESALS